MNQKIKTPHAIAVIAAFVLIVFTFVNFSAKQSDLVDQFFTPESQLAQLNPTATLTLSPPTQAITVGGTFTVNILLNTGGQVAYGADVNRLRFNPAVLQVVGVQILPGSLMASTIANTVDNLNGTIQFSQLVLPGSFSQTALFTGSGTLATVTFRAVAVGFSPATFDFTLGSGTDSNVAGTEGDILSSVGSGAYTVNPVQTSSADIVAPTISITSPINNTNVAVRSTVPINTTSCDAVAPGALCSAAGVKRVDFYINGILVTSDTVSPFAYAWKVPGSKKKRYTLQAKAYDAANNVGASSVITVTGI